MSAWRRWLLALLVAATTLLSPWEGGRSSATGPPRVSVVVMPNFVGPPVGPAALGIDAAVTDTLMSSRASVQWWQVARPQVVRFPGGVYSERL